MAIDAPVYRVLLRMQIRAGMETTFEQIWAANTGTVTDHPANRGQWLARCDTTGEYHIVSDWVDEAGFRDFENSDEHLRHRAVLHPYRLKGDFMTMTGTRWPRPDGGGST
ncbi:MAG TPA: antibiotic biosynthesis monooxygenase family protein [Rugosimonospora sp.]|nr:antibiotic biosynthesis monooxygenase family protein [Rugosimonospora sp.]